MNLDSPSCFSSALASTATGAASTTADFPSTTAAAGAGWAACWANADNGISRLMFSPFPICNLNTPAGADAWATGAATGATGAASATSAAGATSASSSCFSSAFSSPPWTASMIAGVIGTRASVVLVNLAPNTCPIVNASSGNDSKPESTKSSNNPGSSKFSGLITIPSSALQLN